MASRLRLAHGLFLPARLAMSGLSLLSLVLGGCQREEDLTARHTGPVAASPDCKTCHGYPLTDTNHTFHLLHTSDDREANGPITCLDCHSTALAKAPAVFLDSIYLDADSNVWNTYYFPIEPGKVTKADTIRKDYALARIDTVRQERPVPALERPGRNPEWVEYVTALAHMNGKVDVVFHPRMSDTVKFKGLKASFNPVRETCSAVACHPGSAPLWRFADSAKGLQELEGETVDLP